MTPSFHIYRKFDGCKLSWQESAFTLDDAKAVYRVVQEALTNVFRHSGHARPVSS